MVSLPQNKVLVLYQDQNFIEIRNIHSDVNIATTLFSSSAFYLTIPRQGCKCSCFNSDKSILYYLDGSSYLMSYSIPTNVLNTIMLLAIPGVISDCYYQPNDNSIIFVSDTITLHKVNLDLLSLEPQQATGYGSFHVDPTGKYLTMQVGNTVDIYLVCRSN